jgi:NAD(P)-dependent dehydrogenase (short-subunit alcohol dehydrogenase family)
MKGHKSSLVNARSDSSSNQQVATKQGRHAPDRPIDGSLHPVHGTIEAPIVVVGASGTIGSALVQQLVATGQPVVAVAPPSERLEALAATAEPGALVVVPRRIEDEPDAVRIADELRALGRPLASVVVTFPHGRAVVGNDCGRLLDRSTTMLEDCLKRTVLAQHALARQLVPLLAESGRNARYVIVGGPGSEAPWAGYGHRSVAMAATRMLARVLHEEARPLGVRVQLLSIDAPVRADEPAEHECPEWPSASSVARKALQLLDRSGAGVSDAVVACGRTSGAAATDRATGAFTDVPEFLASLRSPANRKPPQ